MGIERGVALPRQDTEVMVDGNRHPVLQANDIAKTVDWQGDPLTQRQVAEASEWLRDQEYISGTRAWGHGVVRPSITPKGEALTDMGKSVRGGNSPTDPKGTTTIRIRNSANIAIHSPAAQQSYSVSSQVLEKVNTVANALDDAAQALNASPKAATEAQHTATEIRAETSRPKPDLDKLKRLLFFAMTGIAAALGPTAGTDLAHLASKALQDF
ncbi:MULTISPECIES: hypothetical protein [Mycobacterium]|nr:MULTISPECIES: hypothetical protein [Mycobacterium]MDP7707563.1 hypothetical protein [Mycobacterium sp. TY815]